MERDFLDKNRETTSVCEVGSRRTFDPFVGEVGLHDMCNALAQLAHAVQLRTK
jgi:hypothetical protein